DTKDFMKGDDRTRLKGALTGNVSKQQADATSGLRSASGQAPDISRVPGKPVTALPSEPAPAPPAPLAAAEAMPPPRPEEEVSLQQGKKDADKKLADAKVTPQQLRKANDPRFTATLKAKGALDQQADAAPKAYRADEQKLLAQTTARASADERHG